MKKISAILVSCFVLSGLLSLVVNNAHARSDYYKAFAEKYVGDEKTEVQKKLALEVKRVKKCNVCHDPRPDDSGKASKKNRNPYGQQLAKHLTEKDKKDKEKALKVLVKIEGEKAKDAKKSFGDILKAGQVPFEYKEEK